MMLSFRSSVRRNPVPTTMNLSPRFASAFSIQTVLQCGVEIVGNLMPASIVQVSRTFRLRGHDRWRVKRA
jgi:hypothetical protein